MTATTTAISAKTIVPAPIRKTLRIRAPQTIAFDTFVKMGRWSNPTHSLQGKALADVVIEPRAGGRWFEVAEDGAECDWGRVLAFEPPTRLLLAWQIDANWAYDPNLVTEVEIRFTADGPAATIVDFEHRDIDRFGDAAEGVRAALDADDGWNGDLARLVDLAEAAAALDRRS